MIFRKGLRKCYVNGRRENQYKEKFKYTFHLRSNTGIFFRKILNRDTCRNEPS